jgi:hypothetical protein
MTSRTQAVAGSEAPATPEAKAARKGDDGQYGAAVEAVKDPPKPENSQDKLRDLLTNLTERMERLEASQSRQEKPDSRPSRESSIFESAIGLGRPMARHALDKTPPPRDSLVSPGTYFGIKQNGNGHEAAANVGMAQAPQPALPQHDVPPRMYLPAVHPPAMGLGMQPPAQSFPRVTDTRQRLLVVGKRFVRQI